jgi:hypothetical protein
MKQTRLSAAPGWPFRLTWMEVPPHALRRFAPVRTASQLIPGVLRTLGGSAGVAGRSDGVRLPGNAGG